MSFSLHSSTENLGGGRRSGSDGSNSSSRLSWPVKSSIGLMSANASARPLSRNHWKESRWMAMRSGRGSASSMLAKDTRSGLRDREGNGQLLPFGRGAGDGRSVRNWERGIRGTAGRTGNEAAGDGGSGGTREGPGSLPWRAPFRWGKSRSQDGAARQPCSIPGDGQGYNPSGSWPGAALRQGKGRRRPRQGISPSWSRGGAWSTTGLRPTLAPPGPRRAALGYL